MQNPPNLKTLFGRRYRVAYEESYSAERGERAFAEDPWLQIIPCRAGHIGVWGENLLCASVDEGHGGVIRALRQLPCCRVLQDGQHEATFGFAIADFEAVAKIMHPRRRRVLSPEQQARLADVGRANRFTPGTQSTGGELGRVRSGQRDRGAIGAAGVRS